MTRSILTMLQTGASIHLTNSANERTKLMKLVTKSSVIMGNGEKINRELVGTLNGSILNKEGEKINPVQIDNVVVSSQARYNLFSITSILKKGWKLKENAEEMIITKGKCV